jgi:hypothetical protein
MKSKRIIISRSYSRVDQFRAAYKGSGRRITDIHACAIDGFTLFHNEYPAAMISHTIIDGPGIDGLKTETKYLKCKSIEFTLEFEEITKEQYDSCRGNK